MGNRCSIQQSEESNCWSEQSPENRLFRSFWATLYRELTGKQCCKLTSLRMLKKDIVWSNRVYLLIFFDFTSILMTRNIWKPQRRNRQQEFVKLRNVNTLKKNRNGLTDQKFVQYVHLSFSTFMQLYILRKYFTHYGLPHAKFNNIRCVTWIRDVVY